MKPIYRYSLTGTLLAAPFVVVLAATISARSAMPRLIAQEEQAGGSICTALLQREFVGRKTPAQLAETERRCWIDVTAQLERDHASEKETAGVLSALRGRFRPAEVYAVPVHVRGATIWGKRVWAATMVWELRAGSGKDQGPPCHRWTAVIEADPPHRIVADDGCG